MNAPPQNAVRAADPACDIGRAAGEAAAAIAQPQPLLPPGPAAVNDQVHVGRDGWLFLVGGSNNVLDLYTKPDTFDAAHVNAWLDLFKARERRARALGATYLHLTAPEKLTIYPEQFVDDLPYADQSPAIRSAAAAREAGLGHCIADAVAYMRDIKARRQLYWKTDTHWTFEGAFCAYQTLCTKLDVPLNPLIQKGRRKSGTLLLDLGAKLDPPVAEEFVTVDFIRHSRCISSNMMVNYKLKRNIPNEGGLHVGSNVVCVNRHEEAVPKRVVLFGDSFAEYRMHLLTGMLAESFCELHFIWSTSIDWSYVERVKPDILLTECAERFMGSVPNDRFDLDDYVLRKLAPLGAGSR